MSKRPFNGKGNSATEALELMNSDVCGPLSTIARKGFKYFITLIDDYTR